MVGNPRGGRNSEAVRSVFRTFLSAPHMQTSPTMATSLLFVLLVTVLPLPGLSYKMPLSDAGLYLETTDSDGYSITMPPEAVNHSGADIFELEFIQPEEPLSLATLYVQVVPTTSSFYVNKASPPSGGIEFEVETNVSLAQGIYEFSLLLFDSSLGISPPVVVDVILTVASPDKVCALATCSQICHLADDGVNFNCSCMEGYSLQLDGLTCLANAPSPRLLISQSAVLSSLDLKTRQLSSLFELPGGSGSIDVFDYDYQRSFCYYADNTRGLIARVSFDSPSEEVVIISQWTGVVSGLAVDWISGNIYYTDSTRGRIYQYHHSSNSVSVVLEGLASPRAIVLAPDQQFRFLFVVSGSDPSNSSIVRAAMDGSGDPVSIATTVYPVDLAVDVALDRLVVVTSNRSVTSFSFDGRDAKSIASVSYKTVAGGAVFEDYVYLTYPSKDIVARYNKFPQREATPIGFTLNVTGQLGGVRVYHPLQQPTTADADECLIANGGCSHFCVNTIGSFYCSCPLDYDLADNGLTCVNIDVCDPANLGCSQGCERTSTSSPATCTCNPGYQIDTDATTCLDINECDTPNICSHGCVNSMGGYACQCPSGLFIAPDQRTCIGCSVNNGGCSQFCVTLSDGFECLCQPGYQLSTDKTSCLPEPVEALLFSATLDSYENVSIAIRTSPTGILETVVLNPSVSGFPPTGLIYGMDIDVERDYVYYGDRSSSTLMRVPFRLPSASSDQRQELLGGVRAWGVAYDWLTDYVFWTEDETGSIKRALVNSSTPSAEVVITGLNTPRGLAVDPPNRYIYWTESGDSPRVARASLRSFPVVPEALANTGLSSPSGIAIDFLHNRVYWADESAGTIWSSTMDGGSQTIFAQESMWRPFQMVVAGDSLIVTTSNSGGQQYHKFSLISDTVFDVHVVESFQGTGLILHAVAVVDENRQLGNDGQLCPGQVQDCAGGFAGITGTAFFVLPLTSGEPLNADENPIQLAGQAVDGCTLVSGQYLSQECQYLPIPDGILSVEGSSVIATDPDNPGWAQINSKLVQLIVQCSSPPTEQFCLEFEVSTIDAVLTCNFNNGDCSNFCSNPYGPIPVCSCPQGQTLGLDGHTCVDYCNPNPCLNGGSCQGFSFGFTCNCADGYTGPLCETSTQASCPQDLCSDVRPSVFRLDSGDRLEAATVNDAYCSAVGGYCTGGTGQCEACSCKPGQTYRYDTAVCSDLRDECNFQLGSDSTAATVYFDNGQFVSLANGERLPVVSRSNGQSPPSDCQVSALEVNGGDGWMSLVRSGFSLPTTNSVTTLQVNVNEVVVNVSQLSGHLLKISFTCSMLSDCFLMKVAGGNSDPAAGACEDCAGNFRGLLNLGVPEFPRPAATSDQNDYVPFTTDWLQCAGIDVQGCSIVSPVRYYNDSCGLIPVPQDDLFAISKNLLVGNNAASAASSWDTITGKLVNLTLMCTVPGNFCLLFRVGAEVADNGGDPCDPNPCENSGTCTPIGANGDVQCSCPDGYTGPFCSDVDYCAEHTCLSGGTCINAAGFATCICPSGTVPPHCVGDASSNLTACFFHPCQNGGTCLPGPYFYTCECPVGYTGLHCNSVDPCTTTPPVCGPDATCVSNGTSFYCLCPNGEVGGSCEQGGPGGTPSSSTSASQPPLVPTSTSTQVMPTIFTQTLQMPEPSLTVPALSPSMSQPQPSFPASTMNPVMSTVFPQTSQMPESSSTAPAPLPSTSQPQPSLPTLTNNPVLSTVITQTSVMPEPSFPSPAPSSPSTSQPQPPLSTSTRNQVTSAPVTPEPSACPTPLSCSEAMNPCQNNGTCFMGRCLCLPSYSGCYCEQQVEPKLCQSNPCQNMAICVDGDSSFSCICAVGYTGPTCETNIDDCLPDSCLNGGTCSDGVNSFSCHCAFGFTGPSCEININDCIPNPCENGGSCEDGVASFTCNCVPGYTGFNCSIDIDECDQDPCQNGGTCNDEIASFCCDCVAGFTGPTCAMDIDDCDPDPCQNGTCVDGVNSFTCDCLPGYTGTLCSEDIDDCLSQPCSENGRCTDAVNGFHCECSPGYTGTLCEQEIDECANTSCMNGGTCRDEVNDFLCLCSPGFQGKVCDEVCPEGTFGSNCSEPCSCFNEANCSAIDGTCTCLPGYTGVECRSAICSQPCLNGGTCVAPDTCACVDTYTGGDCNDRECTSTYCRNGGTCDLNFLRVPFCLCPIGFGGAQCTTIQSSSVGSEGETIGLSVGLFLGITFLTILVVAAMCFFQKTFRPWLRRVNERKMDGKLYTGATVIHENLAVTESFLNGTTEASNGGMNRPVDNPVYGYLPPQVEIHRVQSAAQPADHTYSTVAGSSDVVPDTIIVNKAHLLAPGDEDPFGSRCVPGPLGSTDIGVPSSVQVRAFVVDETSEATQL